jgi:hypothetical protein
VFIFLTEEEGFNKLSLLEHLLFILVSEQSDPPEFLDFLENSLYMDLLQAIVAFLPFCQPLS